MIIALGKGKSHCLELLGKTKNDDFLKGLAWLFIEKARKAKKPFDEVVVIEMEVKLERLQLKDARLNFMIMWLE